MFNSIMWTGTLIQVDLEVIMDLDLDVTKIPTFGKVLHAILHILNGECSTEGLFMADQSFHLFGKQPEFLFVLTCVLTHNRTGKLVSMEDRLATIASEFPPHVQGNLVTARWLLAKHLLSSSEMASLLVITNNLNLSEAIIKAQLIDI